MLSATARAFALAAILAVAACDGPSKAPAAAKATAPDPAEAGPTDMVMGKADAPVTLIEYASVACPVCAAFDEQILPEVKKNYIDTGKVKLVFREFPTHAPALAYIGEMVARCAAENKGAPAYFSVVDTLFKTQKDWVDGDDPKAALQKIAADAGIDAAAFQTCIRRQDLVDIVNNMVQVAQDAYGVNGTPTFVANGEVIKGFSDVQDFEKKLDAALAKAKGDAGKG